MQKKSKKYFLNGLLSFLLVFLVSACGDSQKQIISTRSKANINSQKEPDSGNIEVTNDGTLLTFRWDAPKQTDITHYIIKASEKTPLSWQKRFDVGKTLSLTSPAVQVVITDEAALAQAKSKEVCFILVAANSIAQSPPSDTVCIVL
ncbi:MAG: hypothetical protein R3B45_13570 [Bdellovibrionota bacterium]